nr:MAG TPA: hypothetical protein [Caudoviricetes sp.]
MLSCETTRKNNVFRKDGGENFYVTSSKHFYVILPSTPS